MKIVRSKNINELERLVVVKLFTNKDENVHAELSQEIDMYAKLEHPNVAKLIGLCRDKEPFLIVFEYLEYVSFFVLFFCNKLFRLFLFL